MKNSIYAPQTFLNIIGGTLKGLGEIFRRSGRWLLLLFLCTFLGILGIHRFAVKRWGSAVLYLLTLGFFGIGVVVDLISLFRGTFKDNQKQAVDSGFTASQRFTFFCLFVLGVQILVLNYQSIPFLPQINQGLQWLLNFVMGLLGPLEEKLQQGMMDLGNWLEQML